MESSKKIIWRKNKKQLNKELMIDYFFIFFKAPNEAKAGAGIEPAVPKHSMTVAIDIVKKEIGTTQPAKCVI